MIHKFLSIRHIAVVIGLFSGFSCLADENKLNTKQDEIWVLNKPTDAFKFNIGAGIGRAFYSFNTLSLSGEKSDYVSFGQLNVGISRGDLFIGLNHFVTDKAFDHSFDSKPLNPVDSNLYPLETTMNYDLRDTTLSFGVKNGCGVFELDWLTCFIGYKWGSVKTQAHQSILNADSRIYVIEQNLKKKGALVGLRFEGQPFKKLQLNKPNSIEENPPSFSYRFYKLHEAVTSLSVAYTRLNSVQYTTSTYGTNLLLSSGNDDILGASGLNIEAGITVPIQNWTMGLLFNYYDYKFTPVDKNITTKINEKLLATRVFIGFQW